MKRLTNIPLGCALTLACLGSIDAAAQATATATTATPQQKQPQQSSAGHDMSEMDHAKMGHGLPTSQPARKATGAPATSAAQAQATGHAGHGSAQAVPPPAPSTTTQQHQAAGHAGHSPTPKAPAVPPARPTPAAQAGSMSGMDHSAMGHGTASPPPAGQSNAGAHQMQMGPMQGGDPPPDARDPNAYNEGAPHANFGNHEMNDNAPFGKVLVDKAEAASGDGERGQNLEVEAWYGNDYHKAWVKLEGERRGGVLEAARTELLWDRAFAPFWSTQLGVRHDSGGEGGSRNWLAFGVQGLAPFWFETEATAYWRPGSGLAARVSVKYEVLFTSRLILEPELEANLYGRDDPEHGIGKGLSDLSAGVRLRYEVTRKFAPYIGVTWSRQFGDTADYTRLRGGDRSEMQVVGGVRFWF